MLSGRIFGYCYERITIHLIGSFLICQASRTAKYTTTTYNFVMFKSKLIRKRRVGQELVLVTNLIAYHPKTAIHVVCSIICITVQSFLFVQVMGDQASAVVRSSGFLDSWTTPCFARVHHGLPRTTAVLVTRECSVGAVLE